MCAQKGNPLTVTERFWPKVADVEFPEQCWIWQASKLPFGYGLLVVGERRIPAHKIAWQEMHGPVPDGLCVLHQCDNPPCVNPSHMFLGTKAENNHDMKAKGRARGPWAGITHCKWGHEFTLENTRIGTRTGQRFCRACKRDSRRRARAQ